MALQVPSTVTFISVDTSSPKTVQFPLSTERIGRVLTIKDRTGQANVNPITIQLQGQDIFQDGATSYRITVSFGSASFISRSGQWILSQGTQDIKASTLTVSNLISTVGINTSTIRANYFIGDGSLLTNIPSGNINVNGLVSTTFYDAKTTSTVIGLGTLNYVSSLTLTSTLAGSLSSFSTALGPLGSGTLSQANLTSTVVGLGTVGYLSSATFSGLVSTPNLLNLVSTPNLLNHVSTANLLNLVSTPNLLNHVSTANLLNLVSSPNLLNLVSTSFLSSSLVSTVAGLGTVGYISSASLASSLLSTVAFVGRSFSSISTSYAQNFTTQTANISATTTSSILIGLGDGFLAMPDIRPTSMSTLITQTSSLRAFDVQVGGVSTINSIEFFGLFGNFNNTVIAEISTGAGTQELLFFKGSSVSDQIRFQTTGSFEIETGVSARLWPNVPQNPTPSFVIDVNSNVGIQTQTPQTTLDVAGTGRFQVLSTLRLNISSITGISVLTNTNLVSTVVGLGTVGYASTLSVQSSINASISSFSTALGAVGSGNLTSQNLVSTVVGLGTVGYASTLSVQSSINASISSFSTALGAVGSGNLTSQNLTSTVVGLGTVGYVSSVGGFVSTPNLLNLVSTPNLLNLVSSPNLLNLISTPNLLNLVSTPNLLNFVSTSFFDSKVLSTVVGLGSATYISSLSLQSSLVSTTAGLERYISSFIDPRELASSLQPFISTPNLLNLVSTPNLLNLVSTPNLLNHVSTANLLNLVSSPNLINLVSTSFFDAQVTSTVVGLGSATYISSLTLVSTTAGLERYISSFIDPRELASSLLPFISTPNLLNLVSTPNLLNLVSSPNLLNLVSTPNLLNLVSSPNLLSLVSTPNLLNLVSTPNLLNHVSTANLLNLVSTPNLINLVSTSFFDSQITSTVLGLGTASYISSLSFQSSLVSTTAGLERYISSFVDPRELASSLQPFISTPNLLNLVSTPNLLNLVSTPNLLNHVSTANLLNLVSTPNLLNIVSTPNLVNLVSTSFFDTRLASTTTGLGTAGYISSILGLVSTPNLLNLVSTPNLLNLVSSPNLLNFVSTPNLLNLVSTPNLLNLVSTPNLLNLVSTSLLNNSLISSVVGLGTAGYLSSFNAFSMSTGRITTSTLTFIDVNSQAQQVLLVSSGVLTLNGAGIGGGGGGGGGSGLTISDYVVAGKLNASQTLTPSTDNDIQFVDDYDPQNWYNQATYRLTPNIGGYYIMSYQVWFQNIITTNDQINIQIQKNGTDTYTITQLPQFSTVGTSINGTKIIYMNGTDYVKFRAYVGNSSNSNVVVAKGGSAYGEGTYFTAALLTNGSGGGNLVSTVVGLGSAGYASTSFVTASLSSFSTAIGPGGTNMATIASTVAGLGTAGYVSTASLLGLVSTPNLLNLISTPNLLNHVSTANLLNLVSTPNLVNLVSTSFFNTQVTSTVVGLGTASYISSLTLVSTTAGLERYISSFVDPRELASSLLPFISTPNLLNLVSTPNLLNLVSSPNLLNLISSPNLVNLVSSPNLLNLVSTSFLSSALNSTVIGLATVGYVSTLSLTSTVAGLNRNPVLPPFLSSFSLSTGSILTSSINTLTLNVSTNATISSLIVNSLQFGDGTGWVNLGPLQTIALSSIQINTSSLYANSGNFGYVSTQFATVSSIVFLDPYLGTPNYLAVSSGVLLLNGTLISGSGAGGITSQNLLSTVRGLGSAGYVSSISGLISTQNLLNLVSTPNLLNLVSTPNLLNLVSTPNLLNHVSTANLLSLVSTHNLLNHVSTANLLNLVSTPNLVNLVSTSFFDSQILSTVIGLGSATYISSLTLVSTTAGLERYISSFIDPRELASSLLPFISTPNLLNLVSTPNLLNLVSSPNLLNLVSTPNLLNLVSSPNLVSLVSTPNLLNLVSTPNLLNLVSTPNLVNLVSTGFLDSRLASTTRGLGSAGYISSIVGLVSTPNLLNLVSTPNLLNLVSTQNLLNLVSTPNLLNLISSPNLLNYVSTANLLNLVSSPNLLNLVSTSFFDAQVASTVAGLGSATYISSLSFQSSLVSTTAGLERYISSFVDPRELASSLLPFISTPNLLNLVSTPNLLNLVSTANLLNVVSTPNLLNLVSTANLLNVVSTPNLLNLVSTPNLLNLVSTANLINLVSTPNLLNFVSTSFLSSALISTVTGLGTAGYLSSFNAFSMSTGTLNTSTLTFIDINSQARQLLLVSSGVLTLNGNSVATGGSGINSQTLQSTIVGLGSAGYVSTLSLQSSLISTTAGLERYISSFVDPRELASSLLPFISTPNLLNLVSTPNLLNLVSTPNLLNLVSTPNLLNFVSTPNLINVVSTSFLDSRLASTTSGLGSAGYISSIAGLVSTLNLLNLVSTPNLLNHVSTANLLNLVSTPNLLNLVSTTFLDSRLLNFANNIGSFGYISSLSLRSTIVSTTAGLEQYISSFVDPRELASSLQPFISTPNLLSLVSTPNLLNLVSTPNLLNHVSTANLLNLISSPNLLNFVSTPNLLDLVSTSYLTSRLNSTVVGLGTIGYISSSQLVSTTAGITVNYSTFLSTTLANYSFPYSGETLFLNYSISVPPYQQLGINNIIGPSFSNVTAVTGNTIDNFIVGFQSDFYVQQFIPTGLWTVSLFSQASGNNLAIYTSLFQRTPGGVETLIATSSNSPFIVPTTKVSLDLTVDVPYTTITTGNTLVLKIFANNTGSPSRDLTTFYEDGNYSHVHTTLGAGNIATNTFNSTIAGLGTLGYVSTLSLVSTVTGLGTIGYKSTIISSFLTVSTGLLTTSSITFFDTINSNTLLAKSTFLFFNNYVIGGATQLQPQMFTF